MMAVINVRAYLDVTAPVFGFCVSSIAAILFWLFIPVTFLIGAVWVGIVMGFKLWRDW